MELDGLVARGDLDRRHARQRLDAALRLARLARGGAEPVNECLDMLALGLLLGGERLDMRQALESGALEIVVVAAIEGELAMLQMQDAVGDRVEEVAIMG